MAWRLAKSLGRLTDQVDKAYPNRNKASDGTIGDLAHQAGQSDHNPDARGVVNALDLTHDPNNLDAGKLAESLVSNRDSRIKYLIWNRKILIPPNWNWQNYAGSNPHTKHIHISVNSNGDDIKNWKIGGAMNPKPEHVSYVFDKAFGRPARQDELDTYTTHDWLALVKAVFESNEYVAKKYKAERDELTRERNDVLYPMIEELKVSKADPDAVALKELIKKVVK